MPVIKIVTIGDGSVGKTCLIKRFYDNSFDASGSASVFDEYTKDLVFNDENYQLIIKDCGGQPDARDTRKQALIDNDIVVLCFSVVDVNTVNNMAVQWLQELEEAELKVPVLLVGCKIDLGIKPDVKKALEKAYKDNGAFNKKQTVECSAKAGEGITDVFYKVIETYVDRDTIMAA